MYKYSIILSLGGRVRVGVEGGGDVLYVSATRTCKQEIQISYEKYFIFNDSASHAAINTHVQQWTHASL